MLGLLDVMLAERGHGLNAYERAVLDRALYQTYAGRRDHAPIPATHTRPAPLLRDLQAALEAVETIVSPPDLPRACGATSAARWPAAVRRADQRRAEPPPGRLQHPAARGGAAARWRCT